MPPTRGASRRSKGTALGSSRLRRQRILRTVYELRVFQALREKLRCKEIWVAGAEKWRNPDLDLPADFEANRAENYAQLRKPPDPQAVHLRAAGRTRRRDDSAERRTRREGASAPGW